MRSSVFRVVNLSMQENQVMNKFNSPRLNLWRMIATFILILLASDILVSRAQGGQEQQCTIGITSPKPGDKVHGDGLVSGTAKIPTGHMWILAHKKGFTGWWPQGGGPVNVGTIDQKFDVLVTYGRERDVGPFEVAAVVVDATTNNDLTRWVAEAKDKDWLPTSFPNPIAGCPIIKLTVEKAKD